MENTSLTDIINRQNLVAHIEMNFTRAQATGLASLIFLSLREQTTLAYQWDEWGFTDIPQEFITWCDEQLEEDDLISLAADIAASLLES